MVRIWGGVIEHPKDSDLWSCAGLPEPGKRDGWNGWTLQAPQQWWGHRAEKATRFYIVGCDPNATPAIPFVMGDTPCVVFNGGTKHIHRGEYGWRPELKRFERDATPVALAHWLVELARLTQGHNVKVSA